MTGDSRTVLRVLRIALVLMVIALVPTVVTTAATTRPSILLSRIARYDQRAHPAFQKDEPGITVKLGHRGKT